MGKNSEETRREGYHGHGFESAGHGGSLIRNCYVQNTTSFGSKAEKYISKKVRKGITRRGFGAFSMQKCVKGIGRTRTGTELTSVGNSPFSFAWAIPPQRTTNGARSVYLRCVHAEKKYVFRGFLGHGVFPTHRLTLAEFLHLSHRVFWAFAHGYTPLPRPENTSTGPHTHSPRDRIHRSQLSVTPSLPSPVLCSCGAKLMYLHQKKDALLLRSSLRCLLSLSALAPRPLPFTRGYLGLAGRSPQQRAAALLSNLRPL